MLSYKFGEPIGRNNRMTSPGMELLQTELDHSPGTNSTDRGNCLTAEPLLPEATAQGSCLPLQVLNERLSGRFHCPGESHPISFSVHIARQASGFAACRSCVHQTISGHGLPARRPAARDQSAGRSLITAEGVRGIYLNELDRNRAADWSAAFASILWEETPRVGRSLASHETVPSAVDDGHAESTSVRTCSPIAPLTPTSARRGPVVVIGFDERPSSPDLMMGVSLGLRRMGCHVIDLGQTTSPCFHFAVHHLEAAGGIFVTGAGCDPAWIGLRLANRTASPWGNLDQWHQLESRATTKVERPTRTAGTQRPFHADIPYQAGLWKLFHALRPLNIVCGAATRQLPRALDALFARLPCQLTHEPLPTRRRDLSDSRDADVRRIGDAIVTRQQHLGLVVDDDGERCAFHTPISRVRLTCSKTAS